MHATYSQEAIKFADKEGNTMNVFRHSLVRVLGILLAVALTLGSYTYVSANKKVTRQTFHDEMRKLWEDHVTWTRVYIISALAGLPDQDHAAARLLKNQDDIGDAIRPFYGEQAGDQLSGLLREHILIAAELVDAAKNGDAEAFEDAHARWYVNADEIGAFLHAANPRHWPLDEMQEMMREHLDLTLNEASARLNEDWEADIAAYDEIHVQILHMADMLSDGIMLSD